MLFGYFQYIIIFLIFGTRPILFKYILPYIHAESMILISGLFYFIFALFSVYITKRTNFMQDVRIMNKKPQLYILLGFSALLGLIATYFYLDILKDSSAVLVTALLSAYPLVTAAAGYLFLNEVITRNQFVGMVIIIAGVILMNMGDFDY